MFCFKILSPLNIELKWSDASAAGFGLRDNPKVSFMIEKSESSVPARIASSASSGAVMKKFHDAGIENGFQCNGQSGLRKDYAPNDYAAFLFDPDGNNIEAVVYL